MVPSPIKNRCNDSTETHLPHWSTPRANCSFVQYRPTTFIIPVWLPALSDPFERIASVPTINLSAKKKTWGGSMKVVRTLHTSVNHSPGLHSFYDAGDEGAVAQQN